MTDGLKPTNNGYTLLLMVAIEKLPPVCPERAYWGELLDNCLINIAPPQVPVLRDEVSLERGFNPKRQVNWRAK